MKTEILPMQIWKSNYDDIFYKTFGGSINLVEMYDIDNVWDIIVVSKFDLKKHFTLQKSDK